jgi:hypothetical protein
MQEKIGNHLIGMERQLRATTFALRCLPIFLRHVSDLIASPRGEARANGWTGESSSSMGQSLLFLYYL